MRQAFYLIPVLLFAACQSAEPAKNNTPTVTTANTLQLTPAQEKNAGITTGLPEQRLVTETLRLTGRIDVPPQNMVSVSFPLGGYLKSTTLLPGMHVAQGSVIAVVEDQQFIQMQQDYLTAKTQQQYLENEYLRQRELNQSKASSDRSLQQAEAEYKSNRIMIKSLDEKLRLIGINPQKLNENNISRALNVYSPISGFVSKVNVNVGKYVNPSEVLFELVNPSDIHLNLTVFEKDIPELFIGQKVLAYTNTKPEKKYAGEIILIGKDLTGDRSVDVHCHFDEYDRTLIPGMFMNAIVELKNHEVNTLPESAVVSFEGKSYLFAVKGPHQFEMRPVTTGASENGFVAVEYEGMQAGTPVVTSNAYVLLMMLKNKTDEAE